MRDIKTVLFSPQMIGYSGNFAETHNLKQINGGMGTDVNILRGSTEPIFVFGAHFFGDRKPFKHFKQILNRHKGPQIFFMGGGGDTNLKSLTYIKNRNVRIPTYSFSQDNIGLDLLRSVGMGHDEIYVPMKSYDRYKSTMLGDKIWFHLGFSGTNGVMNNLIPNMIEEFGTDRIRYVDTRGHRPSIINDTKHYIVKKDADYMHTQYKETFVYIKPSPSKGSTTMWELGNMGRRTICPGHETLDNVVSIAGGWLQDLNHQLLIDSIKKEESRIGTMQNEVANITKGYHIQDKSWMQLNFWKNWNG